MQPCTDLVERIAAWGRRTPDRLAHLSGDRQLTYGELCQRSDTLAAQLAETLSGDRSPVVVLGHKEPELLVGFLGAVKAGHPYVPVDTVMPPQRVQRVVEVAGARLTLTPERIAELTAIPAAPPPLQLAPHNAFYIMFTSGSTGEPKGVVITLGNLASFLAWLLAEQRPAEAEIFLNQVPYSFDVSVMDTYHALLTGGTIVSVTRDDVANPKQLYRRLAESNLTIWVSTPSFAQVCLAERSFDRSMLPRVRKFLFCGETLAPDVAARLLERFPTAEVWNTYGPTEATVAATSVRVDAELLASYSPLPIGYAMPGSQVLVLDEQQQRVPPGERGELVIAGPNVSPGYLGRPDLTERAFFELDRQRAYRTGDRGYERDGLLFCEGRIDNQVKLHGYRIELGDVETHLRALPNVQDAVVLAVERRGVVDSLAAFVILTKRPPGSDFELANQLRAQLEQRVPVYMLPRRFRFVDTFPMTVNGKADRRALAEALT
jgi:D-alanine--poly(phosphoribitol) ligase subunit 1